MPRGAKTLATLRKPIQVIANAPGPGQKSLHMWFAGVLWSGGDMDTHALCGGMGREITFFAESLDRLSSAVREVVSRRKTSKGWRCPERRRSDETQIIRERWMRGGGGRRVGVPQWLTVTAFSSHFCDDAKAGILACIVISSSVSHPSS